MGINISNKSISMKTIKSNNTKQKDIKWFAYSEDYGQEEVDYSNDDFNLIEEFFDKPVDTIVNTNIGALRKVNEKISTKLAYNYDARGSVSLDEQWRNINQKNETESVLEKNREYKRQHFSLTDYIKKTDFDFIKINDNDNNKKLEYDLGQNLETLYNKICESLDEYQQKQDELTTKRDFYYGDPRGSTQSKYMEVSKEISENKKKIQELNMYKKRLSDDIVLLPYQKIAESKDFEDFVNGYDCNNQNIGKNEIDQFAVLEQRLQENPDYKPYGGIENELLDIYDKYQYMSVESIMMYHFLFSTKGKTEADQYVSNLEDKITQAKGVKEAEDLLKEIDYTEKDEVDDTLRSLFCIGGTGIVDGIQEFFNGINNLFEKNDNLTSEDYKKIIIIDYLMEHSSYYDEIYEASRWLGNQIPITVISILTYYAATPSGLASTGWSGIVSSETSTELATIESGATITPKIVKEATKTILRFTSSAGNKRHLALVNGVDDLSATSYAIITSLSEASLSKLFAKIPSFNNYAISGLKIISKSTIYKYVDAGFQATFLNQEIDWKKLTKKAAASAFAGVLIIYILNGGIHEIPITIDGIEVDVHAEQILEYIGKNPEVDIMDAVNTIQPELYGMVMP